MRSNLVFAAAALIAAATCGAGPAMARHRHGMHRETVVRDGSGAARTPVAAPGGADGGAAAPGRAGDPYSQAGYGRGAFGNGLPSPRQ